MRRSDLQLGRKVDLPSSPAEAVIDLVPAPVENLQNHGVRGGAMYSVRFSCPEFTSLCPITGQPDFAHIVIDYVPAKSLIESKSLKLFLHSFRNHGEYHESCTSLIGNRLFVAAAAKWMRVTAFWYPRGGIPLDIVWQAGEQPRGVHVMPIDIPVYRAR